MRRFGRNSPSGGHTGVAGSGDPRYRGGMQTPPPGSIVVVFLSARNGADEAGYAAAAQAMAARAATMPGYLGIDTARDPGTGTGMTLSWWRDRAAAHAWRDDPVHAAIREQGRAAWYDWYRVVVAEVERGYEWRRA